MLRRHHLDDATIDRIQSGRPVDCHDGLVSFLEDARSAAVGAGPAVGAALATLFVEGISVEKGDLSVTAASNVHGPGLQVAELRDNRVRCGHERRAAGGRPRVRGDDGVQRPEGAAAGDAPE